MIIPVGPVVPNHMTFLKLSAEGHPSVHPIRCKITQRVSQRINSTLFIELFIFSELILILGTVLVVSNKLK